MSATPQTALAGGAGAASTDQASASGLPQDALIIVPVRNVVLFPGTVFPITLGRDRSIAAAQQAVREERQIGVLMQREGRSRNLFLLQRTRTRIFRIRG